MVLQLLFEELPGQYRGEALRNWLRTDGSGIFSSIETGSEALEFVRSLGVQIRTQDFYSIRREVLSVIESSQPLQNYPSNQLIPLNWHVEWGGKPLAYPFEYRIHLYGADAETGILKDQWMTVGSQRQLTMDEVREVARSYVGEGGASGEIQDYRFAEIQPMKR